MIVRVAGSNPTEGMPFFVCCVGSAFCDGLITLFFLIYSACSITMSNTTCSDGFLHIHFLSSMISYLLNLQVGDW